MRTQERSRMNWKQLGLSVALGNTRSLLLPRPRRALGGTRYRPNAYRACVEGMDCRRARVLRQSPGCSTESGHFEIAGPSSSSIEVTADSSKLAGFELVGNPHVCIQTAWRFLMSPTSPNRT
jgi:hypothetical protein